MSYSPPEVAATAPLSPKKSLSDELNLLCEKGHEYLTVIQSPRPSDSEPLPFAKNAEELIERLVQHFQTLVSKTNVTELDTFEAHCSELLNIFCEISDCLVAEDHDYQFFHNSKTTLATLCLHAFGVNVLEPSANRVERDLEGLKIYLDAYLKDYLYSQHLKSEPGEVDFSHMKSFFEKANITFQDFSGKLMCDDPSLIWNIAFNLCSNAIKYGKLETEGPDAKRGIVFSIIDGKLVIENDGSPILEAACAKLNSALESKSDSAASEGTHSSGKGLSSLVCAGAVITCEGNRADGQGTRMKIVFPECAPVAVAAAFEGVPDDKPLILIVDDETANVKSLQRNLDKQKIQFNGVDVEIITALDYKCLEAQRFFNSKQAKFLFADQNIGPGKLTGIGFLKILEGEKQIFSAILITDDATKEKQRGEGLAREQPYPTMKKPLSLREVLSKMQEEGARNGLSIQVKKGAAPVAGAAEAPSVPSPLHSITPPSGSSTPVTHTPGLTPIGSSYRLASTLTLTLGTPGVGELSPLPPFSSVSPDWV